MNARELVKAGVKFSVECKFIRLVDDGELLRGVPVINTAKNNWWVQIGGDPDSSKFVVFCTDLMDERFQESIIPEETIPATTSHDQLTY